ncbi:MAG TPA: asparaginase [Xanthobacteraceae bacterium]|nr:asparaginase [Xanthobacteraceae bacterium]
MSPALPKVCLLIGPGTLHSRGRHRLDTFRYAPWSSGNPRLSGEELLAAVPELNQFADIEIDPGNPHEVATMDDLRRLALRIEAFAARPDVAGIVFVQGTNSLEETAYFLHLTVHTRKPIAITGAQRPFTALSADGPMNLVDAVRVASSSEAVGMGVLVVTNNEINCARDVTKTHAYRVQTFRSRDLGVLGSVEADRVVFYRAPVRRHTEASAFRLDPEKPIPYVEVLYVHNGARAELAQAVLDLGAKGIVVAGVGSGSTGVFRERLAAVAREGRAVVVRASRVGEGRVLHDDQWQEPGMVAADSLSPHKAALLLALALMETNDPARIQTCFDEY